MDLCCPVEVRAVFPYVRIAIAVAIQIVIGMIWYSPKVLGNVWAKEAGLKLKKGIKPDLSAIIGMIAMPAALTFSAASIALIAKSTGLASYLCIASILMVAAAAASVTNIFFTKKYKLAAIELGYIIVSLFVAAITLGM